MKVVTSLFLAALTANVVAETYTGGLTYTPPSPASSSDEIFATGNKWPNYTITMGWTVTDTDNSQAGYPWLYTYTFSHSGSQAAISHIIIEASPSLTSADITSVSGATLESLGLQTVASGNPTMPEDMYGLRFRPLTSGLFSMTWSFYSSRAPVWGDFYVRDGGNPLDSAYNYNSVIPSGFLDPNNNNSLLDDIDPLNSPAEGTAANSYFFHILRPDTSSNTVPEPSVAALALLSGGLFLRLLRRRPSKLRQ